jgi:hypothetical protein
MRLGLRKLCLIGFLCLERHCAVDCFDLLAVSPSADIEKPSVIEGGARQEMLFGNNEGMLHRSAGSKDLGR